MEKVLKTIIYLTVSHYFIASNVNCLKIPRIIDGEYASASDFKYIVAILRNSRPICGGGIIGDRFVLTAAHCITGSYDFNELDDFKLHGNKFEIVAATDNWNDRNKGIQIGVEEIYFHRSYPEDKPVHRSVKERSLEIEKNLDKLQALKLPNETWGYFENSGPHEVTFAGFGYSNVTRIYQSFPPIKSDIGRLRYARVEIMRHEDCLAQYPKLLERHNAEELDHILCEKIIHDPTVEKRQATCNGDSGSPLVYDNTIVGVHIRGHRCIYPNVRPSRAVRVSSFLPLINNAMTGLLTKMYVYSFKTNQLSIFD